MDGYHLIQYFIVGALAVSCSGTFNTVYMSQNCGMLFTLQSYESYRVKSPIFPDAYMNQRCTIYFSNAAWEGAICISGYAQFPEDSSVSLSLYNSSNLYNWELFMEISDSTDYFRRCTSERYIALKLRVHNFTRYKFSFIVSTNYFKHSLNTTTKRSLILLKTFEFSDMHLPIILGISSIILLGVSAMIGILYHKRKSVNRGWQMRDAQGSTLSTPWTAYTLSEPRNEAIPPPPPPPYNVCTQAGDPHELPLPSYYDIHGNGSVFPAAQQKYGAPPDY